MIDEIQRLETDGVARIGAAATLDDLVAADRDVLGKKSALNGLKRGLGGLSEDERRTVGAALNAAQQALRAAVAAKRDELTASTRLAEAEAERLDLTEVRADRDAGHLALITQVIEELEDIFVGMGFIVAEGPEVEDDWHNFTALNFPRHHPARDLQDTFFVGLGGEREVVMRTHTSPVQMRLMESQEPPIYAVVPGRTYRNEATDATHLAVFHQIEALVIDRGITFGHLAGTIDRFIKVFMGPGYATRLRPAYFPFTEPSAEFDVQRPDGTWLELGGCGMVHPNVLRNGGIDPEAWSGFAFGFGLDRLATTRQGIPDLRELTSPDIRFLQQI